MRKLNQVVDRVLDRMLRSSPASAQQCTTLYGSCTGCNCCAPQRVRRNVYALCDGTLILLGYQCC